MMSYSPLHVTIVFTTRGRYVFLRGQPSEHGLEATAAHEFTLGNEVAVFWTVNCELTGEEIRAMAWQALSGMSDAPPA
jgi:hypothetical protein